MKKWMIAVLCALLMTTIALAEGPVLMVQLPEGAQMIENVEFDDGDFIQTYQLPGGTTAKVIRYAFFNMTLEELADGEWYGYRAAQPLQMETIAGFPAKGLLLEYVQEETYHVCMIQIDAQGQTLLFEAVFPEAIPQEERDAQIAAWIDGMYVLGAEQDNLG